MKFFILIMTLGCSLAHAAAELGYPYKQLEIVVKKNAVIKNDFCFPVVIDILNQTLDVPAQTKIDLKSKTWGPWHWRPGKRSTTISKDVLYPLKNKTTVDFGPGSPPTHVKQTHYAYDFITPEKTPFFAMESGIVIRIVSHFTESHTDLTRLDDVNIVEILHADGTVARYSHLYPLSLKVRLCQQIKAGMELGLTGNTGYSPTPHLHVDVLKPTSGKSIVTLPLNFLTSPP